MSEGCYLCLDLYWELSDTFSPPLVAQSKENNTHDVILESSSHVLEAHV